VTALAKTGAAHQSGEREGMAESGDLKAHEATYHSITSLFKWSAIVGFILTFFVIWLIS
jgi:hypothetical protein